MTTKTKKHAKDFQPLFDKKDNNNYIFKLDKFEGPLDLLLYLIKKTEIDIYDIPIREITEQYLHYLSLMKKLDINLAAEFIIMAANLIYIKSKMLLPIESDIEDEYFEDPRTELVNQLLEYQKFKNAAVDFEELESNQSHLYFHSKNQITFEFDDQENWVDVTLFDLINIFNKFLKESDGDKSEYIMPETITVSMKIEEIQLKLDESPSIEFTKLFDNYFNLWELIITFLAILELVKQKIIVVRQHKLFGDIKIAKRNNSGNKSESEDGTEK